MKALLAGRDFLMDEWLPKSFNKYEVSFHVILSDDDLLFLTKLIRDESVFDLYGFFEEPEHEKVCIKSLATSHNNGGINGFITLGRNVTSINL